MAREWDRGSERDKPSERKSHHADDLFLEELGAVAPGPGPGAAADDDDVISDRDEPHFRDRFATSARERVERAEGVDVDFGADVDLLDVERPRSKGSSRRPRVGSGGPRSSRSDASGGVASAVGGAGGGLPTGGAGSGGSGSSDRGGGSRPLSGGSAGRDRERAMSPVAAGAGRRVSPRRRTSAKKDPDREGGTVGAGERHLGSSRHRDLRDRERDREHREHHGRLDRDSDGPEVASESEGREFVGPHDPHDVRRSTMDSFVDLFAEQRIINLNVGGQRFSTSRETLCRDRDSMLAILVSGELSSVVDSSGAYFIDRDAAHFRYILNFLRDGDLDLPDDEIVLSQLLREAFFYQISDLIHIVERKQRKSKVQAIPRDAVLQMIHSAPKLQLPCTYLGGINLSHLKLREATFFASDLTGADLSSCDLEKANFAQAMLRGANLSGCTLTSARMDYANLTGADLRKAQLYKCDLKGANLARADLTRSNIQDANLKGVNLEGATIKQAILIGADLRGFNLVGANLQGANLERAMLQGVNLTNANLQGANLWNAYLQGANLHKTVLKDANLQRADMTGVTGTYVR